MAEVNPQESSNSNGVKDVKNVDDKHVEVVEMEETVIVSAIEPEEGSRRSAVGKKWKKAAPKPEDEDEVIDVEGVDEGVHNLLYFASQCSNKAGRQTRRPSSSPSAGAGSPQKILKKRSRDDSAIPTMQQHPTQGQGVGGSPQTTAYTKRSTTVTNGNRIAAVATMGQMIPVGAYRTVPTLAAYTAGPFATRPAQTVKVIQKNKQTNRVEVGVYSPPLIAPKISGSARPGMKAGSPGSMSPRSPSPESIDGSQPGSSRSTRKQRLPLGVRKYRHNTAGSKYPKLDKYLSQEKLDSLMNQNMQRHFMHYCATDLARQALDMRTNAPEQVRLWIDRLYGDYWRLFFGFDHANERE